MSIRPVKMSSEARPTTEGAGVHLHRIFGFGDTKPFDPFLMMDDFRNDDPQLYKNGFPWHPHRGIETITYVLAGTVDHGDSLGNEGSITPGDVQWMTAGSGIVHQEMPKGDSEGRMEGFQLWANLPRELLESARIDGASHLQVFTRIIVPLSVPALASFSIFQFLWVWNDLLVALYLGPDGDADRVLPRIIQSQLGTFKSQLHL